MTSGTAALVFAHYVSECAALATALRAHPGYSQKWLDERCGAAKPDALDGLPTKFVDDTWKRKMLGDSAFRAHPHDLVDWETALVAASCRRR